MIQLKNHIPTYMPLILFNFSTQFRIGALVIFLNYSSAEKKTMTNILSLCVELHGHLYPDLVIC